MAIGMKNQRFFNREFVPTLIASCSKVRRLREKGTVIRMKQIKRASVSERSGMEQKMEAVLHTYGNLLYRTGMMMLGNTQDVEDVIQEVMLKYMQKAPAFSDAEHEKAWLLRVTVNLCKDMLRFRGRHRYFPIDELELGDDDGKDAESRELLEEIAMLPQTYKIVLLLHYVEGYSLKEIAAILALSENAVKKRMQRAKAALRKKLEA